MICSLVMLLSFLGAPSPLPHSGATLSDMFLRLKIVGEAPSRVSRLENYKTLQNQPKQRNLDNRPLVDHFVPPISLLYEGFGAFEDVRRGVPVPGEDKILEVQLWDEVNDFMGRMTEFYDSEAGRRAVVIHHLQKILRARKDPDAVGESIRASKIGARQITSDGHSNGPHEAIVFCIECKNELSNISCEPSAELVSYVASSFKEQLEGNHRALFHAWRVPALGMTQIGEWSLHVSRLYFLTGFSGAFVQFFGIVMLAPQMRVVQLTPMLPLAIPIDDEQSRWNVFLAFKAASIVIAKLQADAKQLLQKTRLHTIPFELRGLPGITSIKALPTSTSPSPPRIEFTLLRRYDQTVVYRNLYDARLGSADEQMDEQIYVKFTQQYSCNLHVFCAKRGLAPELLGFERLTGGWFALAMKKIDTIDPREIKSFSELETWKKEIRSLVEDFHREGLVHGDLRPANFIFTKDKNPRRMLLVDFDWGGGVGKAFFPRGELAEELQVPNDRLKRLITKEHDDQVLAWTFTWLDQLATQALGHGGQSLTSWED